MSTDDKRPKVIDLEEKRAEKAGGVGFWLQPWEYDDEALGFTHGEHPVVFITSGPEQDATGICMTRETTRKLRDALTGVLESPHAPWASPSERPGSEEP